MADAPHPDTAPDFGARNADVIVRRAIGWRLERLAQEFGTTEAGMRAFFDRHGWPPAIAGKPALLTPERKLRDFSEPTRDE